MKEWVRPLLVLALVASASGCSRSPRLAEGPIDLGPRATVVRFEQPVPIAAPSWEVCFEFQRPGDSHQAGRIAVVLLATTGERYRLAESVLDRQGEAIVCQVGQVVAMEPGSPSGSRPEPIVIEGAELSAKTPLQVRGLRGGSRS